MERITVWMARIGFLSIAACTFGLSFDAIRDVAQSTGAVDPSLAWIVPLAVDGMIVTATAVLWTESLSGRGWHMFPLLAIIGPAALSMWANVAHASGTTLLAQVLAAVPPAGLILSLELVSWQIRRERTMAPRFTPAWVDRQRRSVARAAAAPPEAKPAHPAKSDDVSLRAAQAVAEYDRQAVFDHDMAGDGDHDEDAVWADPTEEGQRRIVVTGSATRSSPGGQLQVDRDDTGRLTLDVPTQARGKEVWSQIIAAVQQAGQVPTQRELADELNVPRSRVRRAIEHNRDEWEDLVGSVEDRRGQAVVGSGGPQQR
jgi:hypothetical protein